MLTWNHVLKELYLSWNKITAIGGYQIMIGLEEKENLAVLDLSHNSLGQHQKTTVESKFLNAFCDLLPNLFLLQHLDLSDNGFLYKESVKISQSLRRNHTLNGFHFGGNHGYINEQMFLVVPPLKNQQEEGMMGQYYLSKKINGVEFVQNYPVRRNNLVKQTC